MKNNKTWDLHWLSTIYSTQQKMSSCYVDSDRLSQCFAVVQNPEFVVFPQNYSLLLSSIKTFFVLKVRRQAAAL